MTWPRRALSTSALFAVLPALAILPPAAAQAPPNHPLTLDQVKRSVFLKLRQAAVNVRSAQAQVAATHTGVIRAQEALRVAYRCCQDDLGRSLDVLNALTQLTQAWANMADAEASYQTGLAQLARATGGR